MTTDRVNVWDQAAQVLRDMKTRRALGTLEAWALDFATRCIERDKANRGGLSRTEQAVPKTESSSEKAVTETELYLTGEFEVFRDPGDAAEDLDIEAGDGPGRPKN